MRLLIASLLSFLMIQTPSQAAVFSIQPRFEPERPRNTSLSPVMSLVLPSFDQWWEGQYGAATVYLGAGVGGLGLAARAAKGRADSSNEDLADYTDRQRQIAYGFQVYQLAGEMSAFHSFRTAVQSRRGLGQYAFLTTEETPADLFLAPFDFSQLTRPTTFVPLLALAGLLASLKNANSSLDVNDAAFTAGISYNAGVGEEALFRGYMMPVLRQSFDNDFWSNTVTATLFAAAHYSQRNRLPLVQGAIGWYLGWLTQRNHWSLRQAVFLHTWWDIVAIGFELAAVQNEPDRMIRMPTLQFTF